MKTDILFGIVACSKTRVRCTICGVFIPKANKCIEQHINGAKHKENVDLMNENGITFMDGLYCNPCQKNLPQEESVVMHIYGEDHSNWMAAIDDLVGGEFITLDDYLSCEKDDVFCEVCNTNIHCSLQNIEEHVNNIDHRTNVTQHLKPINGIFSVDNEDELWCKVCDKYINNSVQGILSHVDDDEQHTEWFLEIEDLIEEHEVTIESFLTNEYEKNAYCEKCHVQIFCTVQNIESHVHSDAHLNRFGT